METLQKFILRHTGRHFIEVGSKATGLIGVENRTGLTLSNTIKEMATCEYFLGINSGPMHIAAALGLKVVTIVNFPPPDTLFLPVLRRLDSDIHWLYPQSVLLHQDSAGPMVHKMNLNNLERAIGGDLYPYWSEDYLDLYLEFI